MDQQVELAVIGLIVAIVGLIQTLATIRYGKSAQNSAVDAATVASTAATHVLVNSNKIDEVKRIVNGQASDLLEHNQALQSALLEAGITPPPAPPIKAAPPTEPGLDVPEGG